MLRKIRLTLAIIAFALITLLFLDVTGTLHLWIGWMAKIQFLPALLALNVGVIVALLLLTLVLGRVYCSVICPLGVFQDIVSWISSKRKKKKNRFTYSPAITWLRYTVLGVFIIAFIAGIGSIVALLDPYGSFGRMASNLFAPIYAWGNNLLSFFAAKADSYTFYPVEVWIKGGATFVIAIITFIVIAYLAWRNGRTYCNTFCPVGTVLGLVSRISLFKISIDTDKCTGCTLCSRRCKASCIDTKNHKIDYSRCVACMDCIGNCNSDAIHYTFMPKGHAVTSKSEVTEKKESSDAMVQPATATVNARRSFLTASALLAFGSLVDAQKRKKQHRKQVNGAKVNADGGLTPLLPKKAPKRETPIAPPGALSIQNFAKHCTACQLCVSTCPNGVLRPSTDPMKFMQPEMNYEHGYCRPECTKCSEVCPTGAIKPITKAEKSATQIGNAVWVKGRCIVLRDGVDCHECERHCPTKAIQLVAIDPNDPDSLKTPVINTEICIGCGACENLCPSRPLSAIYVEGHERHRTV
jgi:ferredoxin